MAEISKIKVGDTTYDIKDSAAREAINELSENLSAEAEAAVAKSITAITAAEITALYNN